MPGVDFTHKSHRTERSTSEPHRAPARTSNPAVAQAVSMENLYVTRLERSGPKANCMEVGSKPT